MNMMRSSAGLSARVSRTDVAVPAGESEVTIRVHRPVDAAGPLPCVFSMHAGGYVRGDRSMDDQRFDQWCPLLPAVGVSVEYRLAPYPGPITDCYTALTWVHDHAEEYGIDRARIGVHGVGAGGGLAAALALVARDHRDIPLACQLLDSPMLDDRSAEPGWRAYLGDLYGTDDVPYYAAAARCLKLRRLPPAFVSVASLDRSHDQNIRYATRLDQAGVPTELHLYPGAPGSDVAHRQISWLRRQLTSRRQA